MQRIGIALAFAAGLATVALIVEIMWRGAPTFVTVLTTAVLVGAAVAWPLSRPAPVHASSLCAECGFDSRVSTSIGFCARCGSRRLWHPVKG